MNEGLRNRLSENVGANNISYMLNDNKDFSVTGYKVMQNQTNIGLLRCAKVMYNGRIKLVYIMNGSKPLSYVVTRLGINELNAVIFNLIQRAMDIKANGFFRAENLELDFNKIFVDTTDYSVHLIYFPIAGGSTGKIAAFDNEFRIALINLFNSFPIFNAPQFQLLCSDLSNGSLPLESILKKLQENVNGNNNANYGYNQNMYQQNDVPSQGYGNHAQPMQPVRSMQPAVQQANPNYGYGNQGYQSQQFRPRPMSQPQPRPQPQTQMRPQPQPMPQPQPIQQPVYQATPIHQGPQPVLTVTSINSPMQLVLKVDQPEYLLGKNPNMVNGAVTYNPAISRVHCKISYSAGRYYLTDLGSANGTFINQQRLEAQQMVELHSGDYIKLANSDFIISF